MKQWIRCGFGCTASVHPWHAIAHDTLADAAENIISAINTLSGKGVTVGITYLGGLKEASLMSEKTTNKYAIVYKDNELIIEPTSLNNSTVIAANDCIHKEFVSINNLIKVESY